jgi:hypothetical protein
LLNPQKLQLFQSLRIYTTVMLPKYLPFPGEMAPALGRHHVESSDRICAGENRHYCDLLLYRGRDLAQRLGFLGAPAGASRISVIADASANLFKAMHNLRTDQSTTFRLLNADQPVAADIEKYLRDLRDAQMPAMANALGLLPSIEFAQHNTLVPELDRLFKRLTALQKEFWDEVGKPKASRRASMPQEYNITTSPRRRCRRLTSCRQRLPPPSTIRTPRSTNCWRSSSPPGCWGKTWMAGT